MELIRVNGKTTTARFNRALNGLMEDVFGFSFARFQALGVWDEQYEYFSVMDESKMVANCGAYHMQMVVDGIKQEFLQFELCGAPRLPRKGAGAAGDGAGFGRVSGRACLSVCQSGCEALYTKLGFVPQEERQPFVTVKPGPASPDWKAGTHLSGGRRVSGIPRVFFPTPRLHRPVCPELVSPRLPVPGQPLPRAGAWCYASYGRAGQ